MAPRGLDWECQKPRERLGQGCGRRQETRDKDWNRVKEVSEMESSSEHCYKSTTTSGYGVETATPMETNIIRRGESVLTNKGFRWKWMGCVCVSRERARSMSSKPLEHIAQATSVEPSHRRDLDERRQTGMSSSIDCDV